MSCKDLALKAVGCLLSHLHPGSKPETLSKIETRLIVRQTTGLPKNALLDLAASAGKKKSRR